MAKIRLWQILSRIAWNKEINITELKRLTGQHDITATKQIRQLAKEGYIIKMQNEFDKRENIIYPSDKFKLTLKGFAAKTIEEMDKHCRDLLQGK